MFKLTFATVACCALLAAAAQAQPVNTIAKDDAKPTLTRATTTKDGKICKMLIVTGSRVPQQTICLTKQEWEAKSDGAREGLEALQRNGATRNCVMLPGGVCGQGG